MQIRLLQTSFDDDGGMSQRQHTACLIVNGNVAFDAGSLAMSVGRDRETVRDIILSHTHIDHIAGLPLFVDDLFSSLRSPIRVFAAAGMIEALRSHIFNDVIYPDFETIRNSYGPVLKFEEYTVGNKFSVQGLSVCPIAVNHNEPSMGFILDDGVAAAVFTSDTADTGEIWERAAEYKSRLKAVFIECAFPDSMKELAAAARHLTPSGLKSEIERSGLAHLPIYVVNIKPMFRDEVLAELRELAIPGLTVLPIGEAVSI